MTMKYLAWVVLVFLFGSFGYFYYLNNLDGVVFDKPFTFADNINISNFKTDKELYARGEPVSILTSYCVDRDFTALTTWRLINATQITFAEKTGVMKVGCVQDRWVVIGVVPAYAVKGKHHLEGISAIKINAVKTIYVKFRSQDFDVQ